MKFYVQTKLSENISKTPEGFLLCRNVPLTHTGALRYTSGEHPFPDVGEVLIKRDPKELFSDSTMSSFEGKDITVQHPEDFVNPDNFQELTNGHMFNIRKSPDLIDVEGEMVEVLMGDFLIKAAEAIQMVEDGEREVSLGYDAVWELISKTEGRHSKIIGNHCAIVSAGRAGTKCAINDHKKENLLMDLKEKFAKFFGKTIDEAVKEKEDEESKKAKDAEEAKKAKDAEEAKKAKDAEEEKAKKEKEDKAKESKDEEGSVEERLSKLEMMVEKLLDKLSESDESEEESEDGDDESEEVVADEDEDEEDESEDEGSEDELESKEEKEDKKAKAGDTMSCAEILAPGIEKSKDIMSKALAKAYKTADGKKAIDKLTGGKGLKGITKDNEKTVFVAAAEMLKTKRVNDFASQRVTTIDSFPALKGSGQKSIDEINKQNAEFYSKQK